MTAILRAWPVLLIAGLLAGCQEAENQAEPPQPPRREVIQARIEQLLRTADSLARAHKYEPAMTFITDVLQVDSTDRRAILRMAEYSLMLARQNEATDPPGARNLFLRAAEAGRQLRAQEGELSDDEKSVVAMVQYGEARVLAQTGKLDEAIADLKDSLSLGFDQFQILLNDPALDPLRERDDFREMTASAEGDAQVQALKQARDAIAGFKPYPFAFELPDLDGKPVKLDDIRGKVTIVDVWGTWCPPCRVELPHFVKMYEKYRERGLEIVGLTYEQVTEKDEAVKKVREFIEKEIAIPYRLVIGDEETMSRMQPFEGFPTTLFLDGSGQVRAKLVGAQAPRDLEAFVLALLEDPPAAPAEAVPAAEPAPAASSGD